MNLPISELIHITHYINPHMFWFKYDSSYLSDTKLIQLENEIQSYLTSSQRNPNGTYKPKIGEIVAILNLNLNKWIRVQVEDILEYQSNADKEYVLWAIDHGMPLLSTAKWIVELPKHFTEVETNSVIFGGMSRIIPAEKRYNFELDATQLEICENWSESSTNLIENCFNDAALIKFTIDTEVNNQHNHIFGIVEIKNHTNKMVLPASILCDLDQAKLSNNFQSELKLLNTLRIPRWHNNSNINNLFKHKLNKNIDYSSLCQTKVDYGERTQNNIDSNQKIIDWEIKNNEYRSRGAESIIDDSCSEFTSVNQSWNIGSSSTNIGLLKRKNMKQRILQCPTTIINEKKSLTIRDSTETEKLSQTVIGKIHVDHVTNNHRLLKEKKNDKQPIMIPAGADINSYNGKKHSHEFKYFDRINAPCLMESLIFHRVFIQCSTIPKPIDKIENAFFADTVHNGLYKKCIRQVYRIQGYSWPHILSGNSFFVINGSSTGKTMSYLPAICTLIQLNRFSVKNCSGPICLIISPNGYKGNLIAKLCNDLLLDANQQAQIVEFYNIRKMPLIQCDIINGCDILVTNALCLEALLKNSIKSIALERLKYFIIDELDLIIKKTIKPLHFIIKYCCVELNSNSNENTNNLQVIITSNVWQKCIKNFMNSYKNSLLCIGSYIEAAVYANTQFSLNIIHKNDKYKFLLDLLPKLNYQICRTIIMCAYKKDLEIICDTLRAASIPFIKCHDSSLPEEFDLASNWNNVEENQLPILVAVDCILHEIKVNNVQNMIHYSLSEKWSCFCYRFSLFFQYYFKQFHNDNIKRKYISKSIIILDEDNNKQIPKLIDFMKERLNSDIPAELINLSKKIRLEQEEKKMCINSNDKIILLCENLLGFGNCNASNCPSRHVLTKFDHANKSLPKTGFIKIEILNMLNPIKYSARLLQHKEFHDSKWTSVNQSNEYLKFLLAMNNYFSNVNNHKSHYPLQLNDLCCISVNSTYYRCKIIGIVKTKSTLLENKYNIKLIDKNKYLLCSASQLLKLPEEFINFPAQGIDLRIAGLSNIDLELEWDKVSVINVKQWLKLNDTKSNNTYIEGNIKLVISDIIFVDNLKLIENLPTISTHVNVISLKENLINKKLAIVNNDQLINLSLMARSCGSIDNQDDEFINMESGRIEFNSESISKEKQNSACKEIVEFQDRNYNISPKKDTANVKDIVKSILDSVNYDNDDPICALSNKTIEAEIISLPTITTPSATSDNIDDKLLMSFDDVETIMDQNVLTKHDEFNINSTTNHTTNYNNYCDDNSFMTLIDINSNENDNALIKNEILNYTPFKYSKIISTMYNIENSLEELNDNSKESIDLLITDKLINVEVATKNTVDYKITTENWSNLDENVFEQCIMLTFYNPECFYIQRCRTDDINKLELLNSKIDSYIDSLNLKLNDDNTRDFSFIYNNNFCLVNIENNYNRGKILNVINNNQVKVFFCDYGDCKIIDNNQLIPITENIILDVPFMSIKCKLIGIKSHNENNIWNVDTCDFIYDTIIDPCSNLYVRYFKRHLNKENDNFYYEVMLLDCTASEDVNIANSIVKGGYATYDEETKHFLNAVVTIDTSKLGRETLKTDNEINNLKQYDIDLDFSMNDVIESLGLSLPLNNTMNFNNTEATNNNFIENAHRNRNNEIKNKDKQYDGLPKLKNLYKRSEVIWQQNDDEINLRIKMNNNVDYSIRAKIRSIKVIIMNINDNNDNYLTILHLFGCIEPKSIQHRICGLYLHINLEKSIKVYQWPRLSLHNDNNNFIKYDFDFINYDEDYDQDDDGDNVKLELVGGTEHNNSDSEDDEIDNYDDGFEY